MWVQLNLALGGRHPDDVSLQWESEHWLVEIVTMGGPEYDVVVWRKIDGGDDLESEEAFGPADLGDCLLKMREFITRYKDKAP